MLKKSHYPFFIFFAFLLFSQIKPLHANNDSQYFSSDNNHLKTICSITNLAQAAIWLNEEELAIGRWDGTITIFSCKDSLSILQALLPPIKQGITMLERINDCVFASSSGPSSIALWEQGKVGLKR